MIDSFPALLLTPNQKVSVVSPDGKLVLVAGNNDVRVNIYSNSAAANIDLELVYNISLPISPACRAVYFHRQG